MASMASSYTPPSSVPSKLSLWTITCAPVPKTWSTSPKLDDTDTFPYFFRTIANDAEVSVSVASLFKHFNYDKVAILYVNDAYGTSYQEALSAHCEALGLKVLPFAFRFERDDLS